MKKICEKTSQKKKTEKGRSGVVSIKSLVSKKKDVERDQRKTTTIDEEQRNIIKETKIQRMQKKEENTSSRRW